MVTIHNLPRSRSAVSGWMDDVYIDLYICWLDAAVTNYWYDRNCAVLEDYLLMGELRELAVLGKTNPGYRWLFALLDALMVATILF